MLRDMPGIFWRRAAAVGCVLLLTVLGACIGSRTAHELGGDAAADDRAQADGSAEGGGEPTSATSESAATSDPALENAENNNGHGATTPNEAAAVSDDGGAAAHDERPGAVRGAGTPHEELRVTAPPLSPFDNFHVVAKGRAYRSAQLSDEKLRGVIAAHGIKTVVNLRGPNPGKDWYDAEKAACEAAGVRMVDVPLSAGSLPSKEHVLALHDLFQDASAEPLLLHCRGGADRSGMISAMWRREVLGDDRDAALRELSWLYGHFPARYPDMTAFIRMFEPSREWIEHEYNPAGGDEMTDD